MDKHIRIVLLISRFDIEGGGGGLSRFAMTLSRALDRERSQPVLCALWDRGTPVEAAHIAQLNKDGIEAFACAPWDEQHPYRSFARAYRGLRTALIQKPADILHSHSEFSDMAVVFLKLEGKAPRMVRTLHNELRVEWKRRPLRRLVFTQFLDPLLFDVEIGVSQFIKQNLEGRWLAQRLRRQALAIHNALDPRRFHGEISKRESLRRELGIPPEAYVVGSVGRLCEQKGYDVLVAAAAEIHHTAPDMRFLIVGEGEAASALQQQATGLGIAGQVIFTGRRSDVEDVLMAMDLFVCSSRWEGLSTVLMEAMAAGIPIVATDIPGNRELLRNGENAWFIPAEDAPALTATVLNAQRNPELGHRYARQAQNDVKAFGIDQVAARHMQLYQQLVNRKSK
jgi:glycosyltransferase involved in cell wall biosynthesis